MLYIKVIFHILHIIYYISYINVDYTYSQPQVRCQCNHCKQSSTSGRTFCQCLSQKSDGSKMNGSPARQCCNMVELYTIHEGRNYFWFFNYIKSYISHILHIIYYISYIKYHILNIIYSIWYNISYTLYHNHLSYIIHSIYNKIYHI